jgi:hypothetical protein
MLSDPLCFVQVVSFLSECSQPVFEEYVRAKVAMAQLQALLDCNREQDEDAFFCREAGNQDQLVQLGSLGRLNAGGSIHLVGRMLQECFDRHKQIAQAQTPNHLVQVSVLEELDLLVEVGTALLTDLESGEEPLIPDAINFLCNQEVPADGRNLAGASCLIEQLRRVITDLLDFESTRVQFAMKNGGHGLKDVSPTLLERLFLFFQRWLRTYLSPDPLLYESETTNLLSPWIYDNYTATRGQSIGHHIVGFTLERTQLHMQVPLQHQEVVATTPDAKLSLLLKAFSLRQSGFLFLSLFLSFFVCLFLSFFQVFVVNFEYESYLYLYLRLLRLRPLGRCGIRMKRL